MASREDYLRRARRVWRARPWVGMLWLAGAVCAVATVIGVFSDAAGRWKYLTMLATFVIAFVHQRLVNRFDDTSG